MNALLLAGVLKDLGVNPIVLAIQASLYILTFFVLKRLLFGRVMDFMLEREGAARHEREKIAHDREDLARLAREYDAHLARIEKEAYDRLQAVLKEGMDARAKIVAEAHARASDEVKLALAAIAREKQSALAALRGEIATLSRQAVEKVLDVPMDGAAIDAAVRQSMAQPEAGR